VLDFTKNNSILLFEKIENEGIKIKAKKTWKPFKKIMVLMPFCLILP
jgi:hypothetical protein